MILAIDAGNTRIKAAVYEDNNLLSKTIFDHSEIENGFKIVFEKYPNLKKIVISSVSNLDFDTFSILFNQYSIDFVTREHHFPFYNLYATPQTLGIDRMILASGAVLQYPNKNRLVIDAGTCITFDYINADNNYLGGAISPGLRLRYQALNQYTSRLPLLSTKYPQSNIGNSTSEAIHSGVVNGLLYEIDAIVTDFKSKNNNFVIILTGGDAEFLAVRLKNTIFANSNFLLDSLVLLHNYNSKND